MVGKDPAACHASVAWAVATDAVNDTRHHRQSCWGGETANMDSLTHTLTQIYKEKSEEQQKWKTPFCPFQFYSQWTGTKIVQ